MNTARVRSCQILVGVRAYWMGLTSLSQWRRCIYRQVGEMAEQFDWSDCCSMHRLMMNRSMVTGSILVAVALALGCGSNQPETTDGTGGVRASSGAPSSGGSTGSSSSGWVGSGGTVACVGDTSAVGSLGLHATPAVIAPGQSTTLKWNSDPDTTGMALTMDHGIGSVLGRTSQVVTPAQTTTYTLTWTLTDTLGEVWTLQDKVTVVVTEKAFVRTGSMAKPRSGHTATLLPDGKVLIAGGSDGGNTPSAELYNPATGTFAPAGTMTAARSGHTATLLTNGKVLIVGGNSWAASAELYDPPTQTFSATGSPGVARESHTATLLASGKVLIAGGTTAEIYDPASGEFSATGNLTVARSQHVATWIPNGKVLLVGGYVPATDTGNDDGLDSAELYDPTTGTFAPTGGCGQRVAPVAVLLADGTVLVGGGWSGFEGYFDSRSLDVYDPATGRSTETGGMVVSRALFSMTLLADGSVLMAGGLQHVGGSEDTYLANAEIYDPSGRSSTLTACMNAARYAHTATLLADGRVLIAGGIRSGTSLASAELYQ